MRTWIGVVQYRMLNLVHQPRLSLNRSGQRPQSSSASRFNRWSFRVLDLHPNNIERAKRLIGFLASALASGAIRKINRLKLALHFGGTLTDKHGLVHCGDRGRARTDPVRVDNGDNLRRRDINRGAIWPDERDEKSKEGCENCGHILMPLANPYCS